MTIRIDLHSLLSRAIIQNVRAFTDFVHMLSPYEHQLYIKQADFKYDLWVLPDAKDSKGRPRTPGRLLGSLFIVDQSIHLYLFPLLKADPFAALLTPVLSKVMHGRYSFRISEFDLELKMDLLRLMDSMVLALSQYLPNEKWRHISTPSMPRHNAKLKFAPTGEQMDTFWKIIELLQPYSRSMRVVRNSAYSYALLVHRIAGRAGRKQATTELFAGVQIQKAYVGFYFFPLHIDKTLKERLPAELLSFLKGNTSFHFNELNPETIVAIKAALKQGGRVYRSLGLIRNVD